MPSKYQLTQFEQNLSTKLSIAFADAEEAMKFLDLTGTQTLKLEEFNFGVQFFVAGNHFPETLLLFQHLDLNGDGQIDVDEL